MDALDELRRRIDETDRQLLETLALRLKFVAEVGRLKSKGVPFLRDHARESALLAKVEAQAKELGLDAFRTTEIFREVIAMSVKAQEEALLDRKAAERSLGNAHRVAFQGAEGAYSHIAARKYFGASATEFAGFPTFAAALAEAERGDAGYAFLPIENTTAGSINETYDLIRHTDLKIVGEEILEVRHCLLALPGATLEGIRRVASHPQALAQCGRFLAQLRGGHGPAGGAQLGQDVVAQLPVDVLVEVAVRHFRASARRCIPERLALWPAEPAGRGSGW